MANNKSIGVAFLDQDIIGAQYILSDEQIGYTAAAQGTVTQATSKSTGVTLNKPAGVITMNNASLATATNATFTLTNSFISANDVIVLTLASGQTTPGTYNVFVNAVAAGTASITLRNISAGSLSEAIVVNFSIIKCV